MTNRRAFSVPEYGNTAAACSGGAFAPGLFSNARYGLRSAPRIPSRGESRASLARKLGGAVHEIRGGAPLEVRADASLDYGFVVTVLDAVRESGIRDVRLVTEPVGEED